MHSADGLLPEDQAEFERILDDALRTARRNSGGDGDGSAAALERLRARALDSVAQITPAAEEEYRRFTDLRRQRRQPEERNTAAAGGSRERSGPGVTAVLSVLVPVLAGIAAVVFLLLGYALSLADPEPAAAATMRGAGWTFALIAALGLLVDAAELLVAAVRNGSTSIRASAADTVPAGDVSRAHEEWRRALLERGIRPFLREAEGKAFGVAGAHESRSHESRTPRLRFTSPDFSSPAESGGEPASGPRYTHPDFSSPRFTSPVDGADHD